MSFERIPFPQGKTNEQLYSNQMSVVRELKRVFQQLSGDGGSDTDIASLLEEVTQLRSDVDALMVGGGPGGSLTPQQAFELSLVTATNDVLGSLSNVYERLRSRFENDADAAILAIKKANDTATGLRTSVRVLNETDIALAEQIDTVSAALGVTNAQIVALSQTVADGDNALATQVNSLSTTVAGNSAEIEQAITSIDGIETRYTLTLNNNNEATGYIQADGTPAGSAFTVAMDKFQVAAVGTAGGTARNVFAIGTGGGVARIVFRGDMFADGSIIARMIQAGAITADKIQANSLAAIVANLGIITAGLMRDAASTYYFDVTNGRIGTYDGSVLLDLKNKRFTMG